MAGGGAGVAVLVASSLAGTGSAAASVTPGQASAVAQQGSCHPRVIDMGTLGGVESGIDGVSPTGTWVGGATRADGELRAVLWQGRRIRDLGAPDAETLDMNAAGYAVGDETVSTAMQAFIWHAGRIRLLPKPHWAGTSYARRINASGEASGAVYDAAGVSHPAVWPHGDRVVMLPMPAGFVNGEALGINDEGSTVGDVSNSSEQLAWEWPAHGPGHALVPLYHGGFSEANNINNRGAAAGGLDFGGKNGLWGAVWHAGTLRVLNRPDPSYAFLFGEDQAGDTTGAGIYTPSDTELHIIVARPGSTHALAMLPLSGVLQDRSLGHAVLPAARNRPGVTIGGASQTANNQTHATVWTCAFQQAFQPPALGAGPHQSNAPRRASGLVKADDRSIPSL